MQAILYYCLRPINRRWFRIFNYYLNYSLNSGEYLLTNFLTARVKSTIFVKISLKIGNQYIFNATFC